jgi:hypothetical protein
VRIGKRGFTVRIKGKLGFCFGGEQLTSYAGLELLRSFLGLIGFREELRGSEKRVAIGGDLGFRAVVLLVVGLLLVGGRRLRHLAFVQDDPLFLRFAGLQMAPTARSLSRNLKKLTSRTWAELDRLSAVMVGKAPRARALRRWTLDIDGTVLTTGLLVERAERGFNPHHRKNPSYYPIVGTLAQTGHVIAHKNRRGNVHDSHRSAEFLRDCVRRIRKQLGFGGVVEVRADSAFFQKDFVAACDRTSVEYALKVPMWPWLNLRGLVKRKSAADWRCVDRDGAVEGLFAELPIPQWGRTERVAIYRKRVNHQPVKGRQLELFNPDDGYWEYSTVATNKALGLRALWHFHNGRGVQEKTIAELKGGFAFGCIPTNRYRANTAWQKLSILAHNIATTFQLRTIAQDRAPTPKRTTRFSLKNIASLRFEWLNKAARLVHPGGRPTLRLADNAATGAAIHKIQDALAEAA